jgi:hypothetical protein
VSSGEIEFFVFGPYTNAHRAKVRTADPASAALRHSGIKQSVPKHQSNAQSVRLVAARTNSWPRSKTGCAQILLSATVYLAIGSKPAVPFLDFSISHPLHAVNPR